MDAWIVAFLGLELVALWLLVLVFALSLCHIAHDSDSH